MNNKLNSIKNLIWAGAILICLLALFVALIIAAASPYKGPIERGGVQLNQRSESAAPEGETDNLTQENTALYALGESQDAGQGYIDSLTFLCDSSAIGLRDYAILSGGTATAQVWGSAAGNVSARNFTDFTIRYQAEGTDLTPAQAAAKAQPARLVMILGTDGLDAIDQDSFVDGYESLIRGIQEASPNTQIIVCTVSSVTTGYGGTDGVNANVIRSVNEWIRAVCMRTGVYYCNSASSVNDGAGWLDGNYASANGKALNSAGLQKILEYLRTHAA
jgi:hypothetical protein